MKHSRRVVGAVVATALVLVGCSNTKESGSDSTTTTKVGSDQGSVDGAPPAATPVSPDDLATLTAAVGTGNCDELDTTRCMLPFPSDRFSVADPDTESGRRINLPEGQLANVAGSTLDVTEWNRNDGFSPGSPMITMVPGVDLVASGAAPIGDISQSMEPNSPTVVVDLTTGDRLAHWVELDADGAPGQQMLIVRSAAGLPEGHHIAVALRSLVDVSGVPIPPSVAFRTYRDNLTTNIESVENRRASMEDAFGALALAGVERKDLQLAWDFTVAGPETLAGRMLAIRDDGFDRLGSAAPAFTVDAVIETGLPPGIARRVVGFVDVPLYLSGAGEPGSRFELDDKGLPTYRDASFRANYTCQIPAKAFEGEGGATRPVVYGHGLLGSSGESENGQVAKIASTNNMMYCATDWIGMSEADLGNALAILQDLSRFPSLADRVQQGILNALFLARVMKHGGGFGSNAAFQNATGASVIDGAEVYYDGNSQGGIIGGAATAVALDWKRAVLGVTGMNYALLLARSVDFRLYFQVMRSAYPDPIDQQLIYGILQMLWDRAEANGYARHMTNDPYPGTPKHQVVLDVGFGDHQVSTISAEFEARTIGAKLRSPALADGRHPDAKPYFGLDRIETFPTSDSVLVYWDSGTLPPPAGNITPAESAAFVATCGALDEGQRKVSIKCADSHEDPRRSPGTIAQKDAFFRPDGKMTDTCDAKPCTTPNSFTLDY